MHPLACGLQYHPSMNANAIVALVLAAPVALTAEDVAIALGYVVADAADGGDDMLDIEIERVEDVLCDAVMTHIRDARRDDKRIRAARTFGLTHFGTIDAIRAVKGYENVGR